MQRAAFDHPARLIALALILAAAFARAASADLFGWTAPELKRADVAAKSLRLNVSANVQASGDLARIPHFGCTIAAHPRDPQRLFVASMHAPRREEFGIVGYYSHDAGATWRLGVERRGRTPAERTCDEAVAFDPDGGLLLAHMRGTAASFEARGVNGDVSLDFVHSPDGGKTWQERAVLKQFIDRPQTAFDHTRSPFRGRLYCNGNVGPRDRGYFAASLDGAKTLLPATLPNPNLPTVSPGNPVVLADGAVVIAYRVAGGNVSEPPRIPVWRSADGGRTFTPVAPVPTAWRHARASHNNGLGTVYPLLAADPRDDHAGRLYCVWVDGPRSDERYVLFSTSSDAGATWSPPAVLSEQPLGADATADWQAEVPAIAVNRTGLVAVSWYDRRDLPKSFRDPGGAIRSAGYNLRVRISADEGKSWVSSTRFNDAPGRGDIAQVRHWVGLTADAEGHFHPAWISDASGVGQIWTCTISVE